MDILIPTPNSSAQVGYNRDRFMINPYKTCMTSLKLFKFLGVMLGVSIRTKRPLNLHLSPCVWKQIVGIQLSLLDIEEVIFVETFKNLPKIIFSDNLLQDQTLLGF